MSERLIKSLAEARPKWRLYSSDYEDDKHQTTTYDLYRIRFDLDIIFS